MENIITNDIIQKFVKYIKKLTPEDIRQMEQFPIYFTKLRGEYGNPLNRDPETGEYIFENKLWKYMLEDSISRRLHILEDENAMTYPPEVLINYFRQAYFGFTEKQVQLVKRANNIYVIILILDNQKDYDVIETEMKQFGYFLAQVNTFIESDKNWMVCAYEPYISQDMYDSTKELDYIHVTNQIYIDNIKINGLLPMHKNKSYYYPDRIYLFTADVLTSTVRKFAGENKLTIDNRTKVIYIDGLKIGPDRRLYGDPNHPEGYFTYQPIKPDAFYKICGLLEYSPLSNITIE